MNRFASCIEHTLDIEGGFVNDPDDSGGATKWGITLGFYRTYVDENGTVSDIRDLSRAEAREIYRKYVWTPAENVVRDDNGSPLFNYGDLPVGVDRMVFSFSINMGYKRSHLLLQKAIAGSGLDVAIDGWLGSETVRSAARIENERLMEQLGVQAALFYVQIVLNDQTQKKFLKGWLFRAFSETISAVNDLHNS